MLAKAPNLIVLHPGRRRWRPGRDRGDYWLKRGLEGVDRPSDRIRQP